MLILVPLTAFSKIEGWNTIVTNAKQMETSLSLIPQAGGKELFSIFSLALGWGLGYFGMPHIITKFMGIKDVKELTKSKWIGMSWQLIALGAATFVGLVAIGFFPQGLEKGEMVFIEMVKSLFHPFFGGIILCSIIAANLSTMDSQILVCGSTISEDLYIPFCNGKPSDRKILFCTKFSVILISLIALLLAFNQNKTILDTVLYSWSGLGSSFGPLVLMTLYSDKINRYGAMAGIVVGTLVVMVWPMLNPLLFEMQILPMIPGFILSYLAIVLVSRLTKDLDLRNQQVSPE
jgi:sodium/proline symporter